MGTRVVSLIARHFWLAGVAFIFAYPPTTHAQANEIATTDSLDATGTATPSRMTTKYITQDGRSIETRIIEGPSINGGYVPLTETERQTTQVSPNSTTVVQRQYSLDPNGNRRLIEVTEEQRSTAPGGRETVARTTSVADVNGGLQVIAREMQENMPTGKDTRQTTSTISRPTANGFEVVERSERSERRQGEATEAETTMLTRDANGDFVPVSRAGSAVTRTAVAQTTEERFYWDRGLALGTMTLFQRDITTESQQAREFHSTSQTYSAFVPGSSPDPGSLVLVRQASASRQTAPDGSSQSKQDIEAINLGNPASGLQLVTSITEVSQPTSDGKTTRQIVRSSDPNGAFPIVWVTDTHETRIIR